jgi:hypothetical protein
LHESFDYWLFRRICGKEIIPRFLRELEILSIMHGTRNDPVSRWAQAAGDGYRPRTESIVLHRRNR